jgi:ankyrin repeat protein
MSSRFSRSLPSHPDLDQQRKLAKELLRAFRADDPEAVHRIRETLPDKERIVLADAQHVLAREYGFESWAALRSYIKAQPAPASLESIGAEVHAAITARDARALRRLLERHAELRARIDEPAFPFGATALLCLAGSGNLEMVDTLLEFGADPNRRSDWWAGPFHVLHSARGRVAERLMEAGAVPDACGAANLDRADLLAEMIARDPQCVHERGGDGQMPLHFARSREVIDMLLDAGADIDARDIDHRATAAEWMLDNGRGRVSLSRYLVERGATADIFLAAALGLTDRARELVARDPSLLDLRSTQGEYGEKPPSSWHIYMWTLGADLSPLQVAAKFGNHETHEVLRAAASTKQRFVAALSIPDGKQARALLEAEPDLLDRLTPEDRSALPEAAWSGNTAAVRLMLDLGMDPRTTNAGGATALHNASFQGQTSCVEVLLGHPATRDVLELRDTVHDGHPLGWCLYGSLHGPKADHAGVARLLWNAGVRPRAPLGSGDASPAVLAALAELERTG